MIVAVVQVPVTEISPDIFVPVGAARVQVPVPEIETEGAAELPCMLGTRTFPEEFTENWPLDPTAKIWPLGMALEKPT